MSLKGTGLTIGYGRTVVGSGIDVALESGQILCLLGPNGCGKTTLFKTLLGLIPSLAGTVEIAGDALAALSREEVARRVAYVPQSHAPPFPFEVLDIVLMGRTARIGRFSSPGRADRDKALQALDMLGIADLAGRDYSRLSGGQRQLVLVARALAQETRYIIMDEPTASLDFGNQMRVLAQIAALARSDAGQRYGIVLSTHNPDQAFMLGADVVLMKGGRIVGTGDPEQVLTGAALSSVYEISVSVGKTADGRFVCLPALGKESC